MLFSLVTLLILIVFNGFFAGSEIAFILVNENKLKLMKDRGNKKASLVLKLKERPNKYLSTIQIGVSIASIFSGVFASEAFASILTDWIINFTDLSMALVKTTSMVFITLITSFLMLLFGELVPKRMAMANPQKFSFLAVYPLSVMATITTPIIKLLSKSTNFILNLIKINTDKIDKEITEEEIRLMVREGEIDCIEKEMIESVFEFDDIGISEIMTHRTKIVAIDSKESLSNILDIVNEERFTRYPVYEGNIDNIIGILHSRELLRYAGEGIRDEFFINDLIRKAYFVPESKRANQLFRELQNHRTHMAIVVDEHGGIAGLITMENLIEEIMGEILDEYDECKKESNLIKLKEGQYLVHGSCELEYLEEVLNISFPNNKYETLSGFIVSYLGKIPTNKEVINKELDFVFKGYLFSISDIDGKTISEVEIIKELAKEKILKSR